MAWAVSAAASASACDNLVAAELMSADGRRVRASETENPELLWGLRGGGGNFGVVTQFEYRLHRLNPMIWGGVIAWPAAQAREVLRQVVELAQAAPDDVNLEPILVTPPGAPPMVIVEVCCSGEHAAAERRFAALRGFGKPLVDRLGPMPYVALQAANDAANPHGIRHYSKAGFVPTVTEALIDEIVQTFPRRAAPRARLRLPAERRASRPRRRRRRGLPQPLQRLLGHGHGGLGWIPPRTSHARRPRARPGGGSNPCTRLLRQFRDREG